MHGRYPHKPPWIRMLASAVWLTIAPAQASDADRSAPRDQTTPPAAIAPGAETGHASPDTENSDKGLAAKAVGKVQDAALTASDILGRVPCRRPKGASRSVGSLPRVAGKLAAGKPVLIVAFGSSSTQGHGTTKPEFNYPNRLAMQLRRHYPTASINVVNAGRGGEDAVEMMARLQTAVIEPKPDLVIWQVGTNAIIQDRDPALTEALVNEGIGLIKATNADLVLIDPQYSPRVNERAESAGRMVRLLRKVAELRHVGIFPRFEVMREWHETQAIAFDKFVVADGLHMNDWGYACFAQLLGDDIIKSVDQIRLGTNEPAQSHLLANKPM